MKVIPKLQDGGFMSLFTQYTPLQSPASGRQTTASTRSSSREERSSEREESTKGKLTEKDLFELVSKVDGLPNDTKILSARLYNTLQIQQFSGYADLADIASTYLQNLQYIKLANFNKKEYDKAYAEVTKNGGLNEYAISTAGQVAALDENDNLKFVSVSTLLNGRYRPLTNSNLLYLRAYQPEYANANQILSVVSNGIGMEQIDKMIREKISLGTTEMSRSGYSVKIGSDIYQGLNVLEKAQSGAFANQAGMTLDGMYKNEVITKDQKQQAEAALRYIYSTLPDNAKTLLSIKSGNASNPQEGAQEIIFQMITSRMNYSSSSDTKWEGTLQNITREIGSGSGSSSSSGSSGSGSGDVKTDPYYNIVRGWGGNDSSKITINKGTNAQLDVRGTIYSLIPDQSGKAIGQTSLQAALESGLAGIVTDPNAILFGSIKLSPKYDFSNVMFNGNGGGTLTTLPAITNENGTKMADITVLDRWQEADKELKEKGINSIYDKDHQAEIVQVLFNHELQHCVDVVSGTVDYNQFGQFLIVDGFAVDHDSLGTFANNNGYLKQLDDNDEMKPVIERALSTNEKKDNYDISSDNKMYSGTIIIPVTSNQLQALTASGQKIKEGAAKELQYDYQLFLKQISANRNIGADNLGI